LDGEKINLTLLLTPINLLAIDKNSILFELPCVPRNNTFSHHLSPQFATYHRLQTAFFIRDSNDGRACARRVY
jgi:hypothetical protein